MSLHQVVPQNVYQAFLNFSQSEMAEVTKKLTPENRALCQKFMTKPESFKEAFSQIQHRETAFKNYVKMQKEGQLSKAGITTSLGYNFFDLRPPVAFLFPVNVPFRNAMVREPRVNAGYGTSANWKATRDFGTAWAGVPEGQRNAQATPDENNYVANYKELGVERAATFESQFAGEGFTDNVADDHLRGLYQLWLQEESVILFGNDGNTIAGNNGYQLGTPAAPVAALKAGAGFADTTHVSVAVVALTPLGIPNNAQYGLVSGTQRPTVTNGLTPSYVRTSAVGEQVTINGGISAVSPMSNVVTTTTGNDQVTVTVTPIRGAVAWAWFVNVTDASAPSKSNAFLHSITSAPTTVLTAAPAGTQTAAAAGLNADHSAETTSFTGLWSYAASAGTGFGVNCSPTGSYWNDMNGGSFTTQNNGEIDQIEAVLAFIWQNFQARITKIWCATDTKQAFDHAVMSAGSTSGTFRFIYDRDSQGNILGGMTVSGYKSKYAINETGGDIIPVILHPMFPPGTMFFDIDVNPYPTSRLKFMRGMLTRRDYYSIEWPVVTRQWTFGTYVDELIQHYMPWLSAGITGIGSFVKGS